MIALIVACSKNRVIGKDGKIPWHIKGEQKRFRQLTTGNVVIMGRHTYEEIGKPLPNRITIVLSNTITTHFKNCYTVTTLQEALQVAFAIKKEIFIAGGGQVYKETLPIAERIYLTEIELEIEGDTYFPQIPYEQFSKIEQERIEGEIPYTYYTYERRNLIK